MPIMVLHGGTKARSLSWRGPHGRLGICDDARMGASRLDSAAMSQSNMEVIVWRNGEVWA
jgi:hypothetical protein